MPSLSGAPGRAQQLEQQSVTQMFAKSFLRKKNTYRLYFCHFFLDRSRTWTFREDRLKNRGVSWSPSDFPNRHHIWQPLVQIRRYWPRYKQQSKKSQQDEKCQTKHGVASTPPTLNEKSETKARRGLNSASLCHAEERVAAF